MMNWAGWTLDLGAIPGTDLCVVDKEDYKALMYFFGKTYLALLYYIDHRVMLSPMCKF